MPRWSSIAAFAFLIGLSLLGYTVYRGGVGPIEFGGTQTGTVIEPGSATSESERHSDIQSAPEFEADDSTTILEVGGRSEVVSAFETTEPVNSQDRLRSSKSALRLIADEQPAPVAEKNPPKTLPQGVASSPVSDASASDEPVSDSDSESPVRIAKRPNETAPSIDLGPIDRQIKEGKLVDAHKALSKLYWQQPDMRSRIQERIDGTASAIYFSSQPHIQEPYVVQSGDQLRKIASKYNVSWQYLSQLNRLDPKRLRAGQKLKVVNGPFGAIVTLSDFELVLHHNGQYVRSYRVCIGKSNSSPVGKFKVLNKVVDPQYTDPDGRVIQGGDSKNPLGNRWLDLGDSYGIHGTIEPDSIGKAESRGCVRMLNADVAEVYDMLETGSEVFIRP